MSPELASSVRFGMPVSLLAGLIEDIIMKMGIKLETQNNFPVIKLADMENTEQDIEKIIIKKIKNA